jgi:thiamine-monophosphate kinase
MDISDGMAAAVHQLAEASGIGAAIDGAALPIEPGARSWFERQGQDAVNESITGGDDYELLIAARPRLRGRLAAAERHGDAPLTRIGSCTTDRAVIVRQDGVNRTMPSGYSHFR